MYLRANTIGFIFHETFGRHSDSVRCRQLRDLERDNPVSRSMPRFARAKRSATSTTSETSGYPFY
jgi:hypothetical protein